MDLIARKLILLIGDVVLLYLANALMVTVGFWQEADVSTYVDHFIIFSLLYPVWLVIFYVLDWYDLTVPISSSRFYRYFLSGLIAVFVLGVLFFYIVEFATITPKTNLFIHVLVFGLLAWIWRIWFFRHLSSVRTLRIALYGLGEEAARLEQAIGWHYHHGCLSKRIDEWDDLQTALGHFRPHIIVVSATRLKKDRLDMLYEYVGYGSRFLDLPQAYELYARHIPLSSVGPWWFLMNVQEQEHGLYPRVKRGMDVIGASIILLMTAPLWAVIAVAIVCTDRGPVFYVQNRLGQHRKVFQIKKFRTMQENAEKQGAQWASLSDTRVTRVGNLLRRTHLDELPQMFNVLRGDISLVGPRPERPEFVSVLEREIPHYHIRHLVKPGFTGWAQIKFRYARSVMDSRTKFEYDLYYIKNRSFILDCLILLKTIQLLFRGESQTS